MATDNWGLEYDDYDFDPDLYNDSPEPNCGGCNDTGRQMVKRRGKLVERRCHSCRPTRLDRAVRRIRWWLLSWPMRVRPGRYTDEAPF